MSMHNPGDITKITAQTHHLNRWNISMFEKEPLSHIDIKSFANLLCTTTLKIQQPKMPEIIWRTAEAPHCSHNKVVLLTCLIFHCWRNWAIRRAIHLFHPASSYQNQYLYTTVPFCSDRETEGNQNIKFFLQAIARTSCYFLLLYDSTECQVNNRISQSNERQST